MTEQKSFKRLVRARMEKTGESYTTELRERTATKPKSARFDWGDGQTRVNVTFLAKGEASSTAALEHRRLRDAEEAERMKAYRCQRVAALKEMLER